MNGWCIGARVTQQYQSPTLAWGLNMIYGRQVHSELIWFALPLPSDEWSDAWYLLGGHLAWLTHPWTSCLLVDDCIARLVNPFAIVGPISLVRVYFPPIGF